MRKRERLGAGIDFFTRAMAEREDAPRDRASS